MHSGRSVGLFQLEKRGLYDMKKQCNPENNFDETKLYSFQMSILTKTWPMWWLKAQKRYILVQNQFSRNEKMLWSFEKICTLRASLRQSQKICDIVGKHDTSCLAAFSLKFILNSIQNLNGSRKFCASLNRKTPPTNLLIKFLFLVYIANIQQVLKSLLLAMHYAEHHH